MNAAAIQVPGDKNVAALQKKNWLRRSRRARVRLMLQSSSKNLQKNRRKPRQIEKKLLRNRKKRLRKLPRLLRMRQKKLPPPSKMRNWQKVRMMRATMTKAMTMTMTMMMMMMMIKVSLEVWWIRFCRFVKNLECHCRGAIFFGAPFYWV